MPSLPNTREFQDRLNTLYRTQFIKFGATPKGIYWFCPKRQNRRFSIITNEITKIVKNSPVRLADVGCGYGSFINYLCSNRTLNIEKYEGYDLCPDLIAECKNRINKDWASFKIGTHPLNSTMFTIMSGTYNLAVTTDVSLWEEYIFDSLKKCWEKTTLAMIFNLQIADTTFISENQIYYAKRASVLELCVSYFGPTKIVLHEDLPKDTTFVVVKP